MMRYFLKEQVGTVLRTSQGRPIGFETVTVDGQGRPDYGALKTDDEFLQGQLDNFINRKVGGVRELSREDYEDWLKKKSEMILQDNSTVRVVPPHMQFQPTSTRPVFGSEGAAEAVVNPPPALEVPKEFTKPKVGRPRKLSEMAS